MIASSRGTLMNTNSEQCKIRAGLDSERHHDDEIKNRKQKTGNKCVTGANPVIAQTAQWHMAPCSQ
jgi:hypothetical protein